jgi:hypothetical protein
MLLIALLLIPVAAAVASFFVRRRAAMEAVNLAAFSRAGRPGTGRGHSLALQRFLLCRFA